MKYTIILLVCAVLLVPVHWMALDVYARDARHYRLPLDMTTLGFFLMGVLSGLVSKKWAKTCAAVQQQQESDDEYSV